jgi:adenylate cyclase
MALPYANGEVGYISWATQAPGGFPDEAMELLSGLVPYLALRIELESAYHATEVLLEVYLGRNAGRRVAEGAFRRGGGEALEAVIWFSDLRGFTAMSDVTAPAEVVRTLDAYFDCVAGAVMDAGGEVLKFIGDAVLAIFPVGEDARAASRRALQALEAGFAALATLNAERAGRGEIPIDVGVALHIGQVMYGNIGARDRLDFTVISAAVNEACRLESMCKPLATALTMSEAFVTASGIDDAVDLGPRMLKGVRTPVRVFTFERYRTAT